MAGFVCLVSIVLTAAGCRNRGSGEPSRPPNVEGGEVSPSTKVAGGYDETAPWVWQRAERVETFGWSQAGLSKLREYAESKSSAALMIVTDGHIVYAHGELDRRWGIASIRKSILSGLYGIYVEKGLINPRLSMRELGIDDKTKLTATEKRATIYDLLKARSGIYLPAASETDSMKAQKPKRGSHAPGTFWYYNNWDFNVLGSIFEKLTQQTIGEAFVKHFAQPLGLEDYRPEKDFYYRHDDATKYAAYKFKLSTRDMMRIGVMFLQGGRWQGQQIVPEDWVEESTRLASVTGRKGTTAGYAYMWWTMAEQPEEELRGAAGAYTANGAGGHRITVIPSMRTVVVHRMDTKVKDGPRMGSKGYDKLMRRILAARVDTRVAEVLLRSPDIADPGFVPAVLAYHQPGAAEKPSMPSERLGHR